MGDRVFRGRRTVAVAIGVALVALLVVWLASKAVWNNQPSATGPGPGVIAPGPAATPVRPRDCQRDPAHLAPPVGPDGRPANYLHTCGNLLIDSRGRTVRIFGVNWSGMEYPGAAPGGLGTRNWQEILDQVAVLGYNVIRLPFTSTAVESREPVANVNFVLNPDLEGLTSVGMLDRLVAGARARGLRVILDRHQPNPGGRSNLWYSNDVSEAQWIADWDMLARRYYGDDTVIGVDLANEPHGDATWGSGNPVTDWRLAAQRAGASVLAVNPYLLVFVEGVEDYKGDHFWQGGNLAGVGAAPVRLPVPNRVVYSPHDYGPAISDQQWFADPSFPANLPAVWEGHWGYIQDQELAPVVVGEFGGRSFGDDADGLWQRALVDYMTRHAAGAVVWSLNPSWDTGGVLGDDWQTVDAVRRQAYRPLVSLPLAVGSAGVFGRASSRPRVFFRQEAPGDASDVAFSFRVFNDGPTRLDLSRVELRYWFSNANAATAPDQASVDVGQLGGGQATADFVPLVRGDPDYYLRIQFGTDTVAVAPYRASGAVRIRFRKAGADPDPQGRDYSFAVSTPDGPYRPWDRVTLYRDGQRVWGEEPGASVVSAAGEGQRRVSVPRVDQSR